MKKLEPAARTTGHDGALDLPREYELATACSRRAALANLSGETEATKKKDGVDAAIRTRARTRRSAFWRAFGERGVRLWSDCPPQMEMNAGISTPI